MKTIKTIKLEENQHNIKSVQKLFAENKENAEFLFNSPILLKEEDCSKLPLVLSNTDYTDTKNVALCMENMSGITLDFNGQTLECSGRLQPLTLLNCSDITVKNLKIDWVVPLSAEGEVIDAANDYIDLKIDKEAFPFSVENGELYFYENNRKCRVWDHAHTAFYKNTKTVVLNSGDRINITRAEQLDDNSIRIFGRYNQVYENGTVIVLRHSEREHAGIFVEGCKNISFENITVYATGGLGILCQFNENIYFTNVSFAANESRGRKIVCGHDDGLHLVNNKGEIMIERCYFNGLMDDPVNVHGICARIEEVIDAQTLKCSFAHSQARGFKLFAKAGDTISFINHNHMNSIAHGEVKSFSLDGLQYFTITLKESIPPQIKAGDAIENLTNTPSVIFRNNFFGSCRARGILITTPKSVIVEDNIFETAGSAILIAGDANGWYESGACHDIIIRNNTFMSECLTSMYQFCEAIISICPEIPEAMLQYPYHSNITIENNKFNPFDYPVLFALSVENLKFSGNKIYRNKKFRSYHPNKNMITLNYCKQVQIKDNILTGEVLGRNIKLNGTPAEEVTISKQCDCINIYTA